MGSVSIVKASAGSGKTYRLAYEYVKRVVETPELYRHILAVTFTNKAADEMKRRIIGEINDLANGHTPSGGVPAFAAELSRELALNEKEVIAHARKARTRILHDYSRFAVLTIDKFFQRIIRAFIRELGGDADFTLELQADSILDTAADRLIESVVADPELNKWLTDFAREQIGNGKRWDIKKEITALGREIFREHYKTPVGLSKKDVLTAVSAAETEVQKHKDRMRQLAAEALEIIDSHNLCIEDFMGGRYSFAFWFYKAAVGDIEGGYGKRVVDALLSDDKWCAASSPRKADIHSLVPALRPILSELCRLYDENIAFMNSAALLRANYRTYALLADLSQHVAEICRERGVMLIQETGGIINRLVEGNDAPFIFEKVGNAYSHYMMDEFQDTSLTQWENFRPLLRDALSQSDRSPVLIVGDVKQSIYRWRGGDWEILGKGVASEFAEVAEHSLEKNYRSGGNIIEFNNRLIAGAVAADSAFIASRLDEAQAAGVMGEEEGASLRGMAAGAYSDLRQTPGRDSAEGRGYVRVVNYDEGHDEHIIKLVEELQRRGYHPGDIAMLVRSNDEGVRIANMLLEYKSANPGSEYSYDVVTREALLIAGSPVIQFVTACFRLAAGRDVSMSEALFKRYTGVEVEAPFTGGEFISSLRSLSLEEAFEKTVMEYRLGENPADAAYLQAYHDKLLSFADSRISDIPLFLDWWDENSAKESIEMPDSPGAMTVITIHKSKGLQYPVVILPYASWKIAPSWKTLMWVDTDREPFAALGRVPVRMRGEMAQSYFAPYYYRELVYSHIDNINMLYVAVTRAENELHIFTPVDRRKEKNLTTVADLVSGGMENVEMRRTEEGGDTVYEFGQITERHSPEAPSSGNDITDISYASYPFDGRLALSRAEERYGAVLSPRHYGRLMHKVFESISSRGEIAEKLDAMRTGGVISGEDALHIERMITSAFDNPLIASWYDGSWEEVRNENDIILPATVGGGEAIASGAALRRPDRVMIKDGRVVVVDYKFGQKESKYHSDQVAQYMKLMRGMGYGDVEGYVWYVEKEQILSVISD